MNGYMHFARCTVEGFLPLRSAKNELNIFKYRVKRTLESVLKCYGFEGPELLFRTDNCEPLRISRYFGSFVPYFGVKNIIWNLFPLIVPFSTIFEVVAPKAHLRRRERIPTATFLPVLVSVRVRVRVRVRNCLGWFRVHRARFPTFPFLGCLETQSYRHFCPQIDPRSPAG